MSIPERECALTPAYVTFWVLEGSIVQKFEVKLSPEYLAKIEADLQTNVGQLGAANAFAEYNRGGGPAGSYDRHYDKSTGIAMSVTDRASQQAAAAGE